MIWVGTDDGNVQVTRDGGATWRNVGPNIRSVPTGRWVSRVEASHHAAGTAYVTFDGHRSDDTAPYLVKTVDFGATWTDVTGNLPRSDRGLALHTVVEDGTKAGLLKGVSRNYLDIRFAGESSLMGQCVLVKPVAWLDDALLAELMS